MFMIQCVDSDGYSSNSWEFDYDVSRWHLQHWLQMSCHGLRDKVEVWEDTKYAYYENGRAFFLRYYGKNENVGQATIMSGEVTPLGGDFISYHWNTTYQFSSNLLYEPIPFEMLRAYEEMPQIEVSVNGTTAVCHELNCGYAYVEPVGEVTGFTYNDDTRHLTIEGVQLPQDTDGIRFIEFAKSLCELNEEPFST